MFNFFRKKPLTRDMVAAWMKRLQSPHEVLIVGLLLQMSNERQYAILGIYQEMAKYSYPEIDALSGQIIAAKAAEQPTLVRQWGNA